MKQIISRVFRAFAKQSSALLLLSFLAQPAFAEMTVVFNAKTVPFMSPNFPHAWIWVTGDYHGQHVDRGYDWQPDPITSAWSYIAVPGHPEDANNYKRHDDANLSVPITDQQYEAMLNAMSEWQPHVTTYNYFVHNCVGFTADVAKSIGLKTPDPTFIDPVHFMYLLQAKNPQYVTVGTKTLSVIKTYAAIERDLSRYLPGQLSEVRRESTDFDKSAVAGAKVIDAIMRATADRERDIFAKQAAAQQTMSLAFDRAQSLQAQQYNAAYQAAFNATVSAGQQAVGGTTVQVSGEQGASTVTLPECVAAACVSTQVTAPSPTDKRLREPGAANADAILARKIGLDYTMLTVARPTPILQLIDGRGVAAGPPVVAPIAVVDGGAALNGSWADAGSVLAIHLIAEADLSLELIGNTGSSVWYSRDANAFLGGNTNSLAQASEVEYTLNGRTYKNHTKNMYVALSGLLSEIEAGNRPMIIVRVNGAIEAVILTHARVYNKKYEDVDLSADMVSGVGNASTYGYNICSGRAPFDYSVVASSIQNYAEGGGRSCDHKTECGLSVDKAGNVCAIFNVQGENGGLMGRDTATTTHGHLKARFQLEEKGSLSLIAAGNN